MSPALQPALSRRERQIMDILYRLGRATANEVMADLSGEPNYSTVRTQLRVLESKGHVRHEEEGLRYVYMPTVPRHAVRQSALRHLLETSFEGYADKFLWIWIAGIVMVAAISIAGLIKIAWLVSRSKPVGSGRWKSASIAVAGVLRLKRTIRLFHNNGTVLGTYGLFRPTVLLPRESD